MPVFGATNAERPVFDVACVEAYDEQIYHYARVVWSEARGEDMDGKLAVISALRNGARGYKAGKLDTEIVEIVAGEIKKSVGHKFHHWIRLEHATDKAQLRRAKRAIKNGMALRVGNHWFY